MTDRRVITGDKKIDDLIYECTASLSKDESYKYMLELFSTLGKLAQEYKSINDVRLIASAMSELRDAFKVFSPYRDVRKVTIFGSARTPGHINEYKMTESLAKKFSKKGWMIITGAGGGIMEAGNKGAEPNTSFGLNILLPFEQEANAFILENPKLLSFYYFFTRKLIFIKESDATVLFPGGFGTFDELFENITLAQTGRSSPRPIILCSAKNSSYWDDLSAFIEKHFKKSKLISPEDTDIFTLSKDVDETVGIVENFYKNYHSIKYQDKHTAIRLNCVLEDKRLEDIRHEFKDILISGTFEQILPGEFEKHIPFDQKSFTHKPRLYFMFNRTNFGRLFQLINFINR